MLKQNLSDISCRETYKVIIIFKINVAQKITLKSYPAYASQSLLFHSCALQLLNQFKLGKKTLQDYSWRSYGIICDISKTSNNVDF